MIEKEESQPPRFRYNEQFKDFGFDMGVNICIPVEQAQQLQEQLNEFFADKDVIEIVNRLNPV